MTTKSKTTPHTLMQIYFYNLKWNETSFLEVSYESFQIHIYHYKYAEFRIATRYFSLS